MARVELDLIAKINQLQKGLDDTQKGLRRIEGQSQKTNQTIQNNMNNTGRVVEKLTNQLKIFLSIGAAIQFTKAIINVRKEFQVFRTVLENTLGSAEAANREFDKIQQFAAETPFSVRELTDAFVRLVNQGFKPTTKELRALGDLAASTGKQFTQLSEAIIDAQVGEFERLKEFGIRAAKQGDIVTFTFKGIETQVKFTAEAIQDYIISLGNAEGVTGAMEKISKTLEGRISNLGDSWDTLLDTLGGRTEGVMFGVIDLLGQTIDKVNELLLLTEPASRGKLKGKGIVRSYIIGETDEGDPILDLERINQELKVLKDELTVLEQFGDLTLTGSPEESKERQDYITELKETITAIENAITVEEKRRKANEIQTETIKDIQEQIKNLNEELAATAPTDAAARLRIEAEIKARQDLIKSLTQQREELAKLVKVQKEDDIELEQWMLQFPNAKKEIADFFNSLTENTLDFNKLVDDNAKDNADKTAKEERDRKDAENQKKEAIQQTFETSNSLLDILAERQEANLQAELARVGDNEAAKEQILKEFAKKDQNLAVLRTIMSGAEGIVKTGANLGYPAAIPFQIAQALQTLAQIAIIRQQKFARGTYQVLGGRRHAQGGVNIGIGEAEEGEGVAVFSRNATQRYGKFLPAFVKAINENKGMVTSEGSYSFNYDDSKQLSKLDSIRELLAKPEIRYEKGYRIETRKGQTTRVKL